MAESKTIDYGYRFDIKVRTHEKKEPHTNFLLEIFVDSYLPAQTDHICYEDYLIMQTSIFQLLSSMLGSEFRMVNICQTRVKQVKFHGEKFSIFCKISMKEKKQSVYDISLDFLKDDKPIFEVRETLLIKK